MLSLPPVDPGDPARLVASAERIRDALGWDPRYPDLTSMVESAWHWRLRHPRWVCRMIISRTPLRISFAGGGSDLQAFYGQEPGAVLSTAIDKYIYLTVNHKFDAVHSSQLFADGDRASVGELQHELIRESLKQVGIEGGIEVTSVSDIPSGGTGLGSSSTYTVGLLNALYAHTGRSAGAERLAREACDIEIVRCGKPIGKQDQYIAAYGGLQFIQFNADETVFVDPSGVQPRDEAGAPSSGC